MYVRPNILRSEAECPHCKVLPSDEYLDWFQALRTECGFGLPFKSMYRCPEYNTMIGGSQSSVHLLCADPGVYGAADIGIPKSGTRRRWIIMAAAIQLGMNNFEVCDYHLHVGIAPDDHVQVRKLYWGISR